LCDPPFLFTVLDTLETKRKLVGDPMSHRPPVHADEQTLLFELVQITPHRGDRNPERTGKVIDAEFPVFGEDFKNPRVSLNCSHEYPSTSAWSSLTF
jgi:hypothetical protein